MNNRVVITGLGVISPLGNTIEEYWDGLAEGRSGIARVTRFDIEPYPAKACGDVKEFDPIDFDISKKEARRLDPYQQFAVAATALAMADSGLDLSKTDNDRIGVIIGTGIGGIKTFQDQTRVLLDKGWTRVSPFFIPMMICDMASGVIAMRWGLRGPNYAAVSACASGSHAMCDAFWTVKRGETDVMVTGGSEMAICETGWAAFCAERAMSTSYQDEPHRSSRPFDLKRDGFVMGAGAGVLIFENAEHALKRNARIYAEVAGVGASADAHHMTAPAPDGNGAARAMRMALDHAGMDPTEVDLVNAHGTATSLGDIAETTALKSVFGEHAYKLSVNSTKSLIGHLLGAAGALELIACIQSIQTGVIHPTVNLEYPDEQCDLDYTPNVKKEKEVRAAMSNSFGFGGHNASIIVKDFRP